VTEVFTVAVILANEWPSYLQTTGRSYVVLSFVVVIAWSMWAVASLLRTTTDDCSSPEIGRWLSVVLVDLLDPSATTASRMTHTRPVACASKCRVIFYEPEPLAGQCDWTLHFDVCRYIYDRAVALRRTIHARHS